MRLILLHGWTMAGDVFAPLVAALAATLPGLECEVPDLPGHGDAGPGGPAYPASIAGAARMLADRLERGGPAVVAGWSMGALVAWEHVARRGTAGLRGLVSIDMSPRPLPDWPLGLSGLTPAEARALSATLRADWAGAARPMAAGMFAGREGAPTLSRAQATARIAACDPAVMVPFWDEMLDLDHRATVAGLDVPCLAIHGAESRVYPPAVGDWIAATAPRGRCLRIAGAGHAPILEAPGPTAAALAGFLAGLA